MLISSQLSQYVPLDHKWCHDLALHDLARNFGISCSSDTISLSCTGLIELTWVVSRCFTAGVS